MKNASLNNLNNSDIRNKRNSSVPRRKSEILASTIINSLERDINELIQETTLRPLKNKLIAINGKIRYLLKLKNYSNYNSFNKILIKS